VLSVVPLVTGPESLSLDSAHALFDQPGCPACRHASAAIESYLEWLAGAGHRDAATLNRLSESRGMCAAHTRRLLARPGTAARLRTLYGHVIDAALQDIQARPAGCPACEHAGIAGDRLLGFLIDEATRGDRRTYKEHGGLCLPHLRRAAVCRRGADILWLVRFMVARLTEPSPGMDLLTGHGEPVPAGGDLAECVVCGAAAEAERAERSRRNTAGGDCLCPQHLREVARVRVAGDEAADLLTRQAALHAARLTRVLDGRSRRLGNYLSVRAREALSDPDCPVCLSRETAAEREISRVAMALSECCPTSSARLELCFRHARDVHAVDQQAGATADAQLRIRGRQILAKMRPDCEHDAGVQMAASLGQSATAVRRAAGFLDGSAP